VFDNSKYKFPVSIDKISNPTLSRIKAVQTPSYLTPTETKLADRIWTFLIFGVLFNLNHHYKRSHERVNDLTFQKRQFVTTAQTASFPPSGSAPPSVFQNRQTPISYFHGRGKREIRSFLGATLAFRTTLTQFIVLGGAILNIIYM
jgi:hypothetical protein